MRLLCRTMESIWDPDRLINARTSRELQINEAAEQLDITPEYLSMLENGHKAPSNKLINNMCKIYVRRAAFFLHEDQQMAAA